MKTVKVLKVRNLGTRVVGPAAVVFTVFALGAPVKWSIAQWLLG